MLKIFQFFCAFVVFSGSMQSFFDQKADTQLIQAVKAGDKKAVKKLLKSGADVNELGQDSKTALDAAVEYGHAKLVLDLIKHHGKVTSEDNQNYLKILCKDYKKKLWMGFGIGIGLFILMIPFTGWALVCGASNSLAAVCFLLGELVGVAYILSLPFQAYPWARKSQQNWMLPVSEIV